MENKNQSAYPFTPTRPWDTESENGFSGLTKREYFAGLAMQGLLAKSDSVNVDEEKIALNAVKCADAILEWFK